MNPYFIKVTVNYVCMTRHRRCTIKNSQKYCQHVTYFLNLPSVKLVSRSRILTPPSTFRHVEGGVKVWRRKTSVKLHLAYANRRESHRILEQNTQSSALLDIQMVALAACLERCANRMVSTVGHDHNLVG